jgi:hypothetical protein
MTQLHSGTEPEITAMSAVHAALKELDPQAQKRVLSWIIAKLNVEISTRDAISQYPNADNSSGPLNPGIAEAEPEDTNDSPDGISPVAKKWLTRNGFESNRLSTIFSLGGDEIDLIAKAVPGKGKRERMRSVFLLKGVAAYLGTGASRFTHEQVKEASLHYDAFDATNFAVHLKSFSSDVTGNKEAGYTLTPRGLAAAAEILKGLIHP